MRKILGSIISIGVVAALMGIGTFAYFNDTESANFTINKIMKTHGAKAST